MKETTRRKRPEKEPPRPRGENEPNVERQVDKTPPATTPAEERGERIETGKAIHRGGRSTGYVPGATEQPRPRTDPDESHNR